MAVTVQTKGTAMKITGMDSLLGKLQQNRLYGKYWRAGLSDLIGSLKDRAKSTAPVRSGRLKAGMITKMHQSTVPLWALLTNNTTRSGGGTGARYPWVLEYGRAGRTIYNYRSGKLKGRPTKGWFSWVLPAHRKQIEQALNRIADAIEDAFGSRMAA